ncbi:lysozyme-like protein [Pectobacterium phage PEAT2]|uniref:Endolysin n=1 Tax=Pectobacterium phage PEAT2 TaxID=2053078 RepID=A0A2H4N7D1_9CAUD|nr:endolysin [Pectobacterium phage PEAT2]ATV25096.1 lysozyme-like protein [Pectobacterium phage PEAT2]
MYSRCYRMKNPLSKQMTAILTAFAMGGTGTAVVTQTDILNQFLNEKEGNKLTAYLDSANPPIWTICRGVTRIDGKPVTKGMRLTEKQCDLLNDKEAQKSLKWVRDNIPVKLNPVQQVGIASFCPYNIGPTKCKGSTFFKLLQKGDWKNACKQIPRWVFDGGRDCRIKSNNCSGQPIRREQEEYLCLYTLGEK